MRQPTPPPLLSVVVVAHDSGADLARCADSVLRQPLALELIVVDNASSDGALLALAPDPRLRLLLNPGNRGFGRACNQGAELARADTLLFLNPDCVLPEGALPTLLATLGANPGLGVLGAQLLNADGSEQAAARRRDPTPLRALRQLLRISSPLPAGEGPGERVRHPQAPQPAGTAPPTPIVPTDAVSGALMLIPRAVFRSLHGFDEGYVLHCEDLDLCRRARQAGFDVALAPSVRVPHAKGTSSRRRPLWVEWQKHRGMWRYFRHFDAATTPRWAHPLLWLGVWAHFAWAVPRALWRARHRA